MKKRSISLVLVIVFSLCIVLNTAQPSLALTTDQTGALNAYYQILNSFEWKSGKPVYPDDYGGEYIDGSLLYVWIVHKNPMNQQKYEQLCEGSEYVRFLDAAYSLNELNSLADDLMISGKDYNISGHYVDRVKNKLCMCIAPNGGSFNRTDYAELSYSETIDALTRLWVEADDKVIFREQDWLNLESTDYSTIDNDVLSVPSRNPINLVGGSAIFAKDPNGLYPANEGTLGFCGTYNDGNYSYNAVLTAGHVIYQALRYTNIANTADLYYLNDLQGSKFAESCIYKCGNIGHGIVFDSEDKTGDFAICKTTSNQYCLTNKVKIINGTVDIVGTVLQGWLPVGTYVHCYGITTAYHLGTVSQLDINSTAHGIDGLVMVYMSGVDNGDSGGPVFTYTAVGTQTYGFAEGTITGSSGVYMYYCPISYAIDCGFSVVTS